MTSRELVIRMLNQQPVDRVPRDLWITPEAAATRGDELAELQLRFPSDIVYPEFELPAGKRSKGKPGRVGQYTDAWGCRWRIAREDGAPQLVAAPLARASLEAVAAYDPPFEVLEKATWQQADQGCAETPRFVLARSQVEPLRRWHYLRGSEAALADLAEGSAAVRTLLARIHEYNCRELACWATTEADGVVFGDDWATREGLVVSPDVWRDLFRPMYREYCRLLHEHDKFAFLKSTGNISRILGDLVRMGVDAVHADLLAMNLARVAGRYRGRIVLWGGLDEQEQLDHATPQQVREMVQQVRQALDTGSGGLIAQCRIGAHTPLKNLLAYFEQWLLPLPAAG